MYDVFHYVRVRLVALPRTQRGASAVEYGLLVALVAVVVIVAVTTLGGRLGVVFRKASGSLPAS